MNRVILAGLFVAALSPTAAPARAGLPMSPVLRDGPGGMSQPPVPAAKPTRSPRKEAAKPPSAPAPRSGTTEREQSGEHAAGVVATAPIPPLVATAPEPAAKPLPPQPTAAARHQRPRHYAHRRYAPAYQPAAGWFGGRAASSAAQLGPNPYSPNGGN